MDKFKKSVDSVIDRYSEKVAFTYMRNSGEEDKVTFKKLGIFIHDAMQELNNFGLVQGDRVAIISPHSPIAVFVGMALMYAEITVVLVDASLPQEEMEKLLLFSDVKAMFTTSKIFVRLNSDIIQKILCFNLEQGLEIVPFNIENADCCSLEPTIDPDNEVIAILYSSGTTGEMKGIMVTYESVLKAREVFVRLSGLKDYMTYLLVLPFNHIAGFTGALTFFLTGCELGFIEDVNASKLQNGLLKFQPYYFAMVPKVYEVMEEKIRAGIHEKGKIVEILIGIMFKLSGFLRKRFGVNIGRKMFKSITKQVFGENIFGVGTGASPCKAKTTEFFLNLGLEWANLYATTETGVPIVATGVLDRYPVGTVGNVNHHPEIQIKILNASSDAIGEIVVKSELMMKGYFKRPDLTEEVFDDGFFKTGDYGYIDRKGYLYIIGRIKESIILQNGKKVSPSDVDDYYSARVHGYDIASRGITNEQYDEIHMFIADKDYTANEQKKIIALFEKMSRNAPSMYKLSDIHFISEIPRTSVGKVKRFCLNAENGMSTKETTSIQTVNTYEYVLKEIKDIAGVNEDFAVSGKMRIKEDIGMDSLNIFELCVSLGKKYSVSLESYLHDNITIGEIVDIIEHKEKGIYNFLNNTEKYPLKRTPKDYKEYHRFMKISKLIWKFEVTGTEHINSDENYIFCPNHESYFDGMWIVGNLDDRIQRSICSVAADYLFEKKVFRKGLIWMGGIPVHRSGNTITALKHAYQCIIQEGYNLLIHPEGTRTRNGKLGEFKQGAAKLSIESGIKIIPVCINGAYEVFPPHCKLPRLFDWKHLHKYILQIKFGTPIVPDGMKPEEITSEIRRQIIDMKNNSMGGDLS